MNSEQKPFEMGEVPHPGETVQEYLEFNSWSQRDLARRTGVSPKIISEICNGKTSITPPTALAFENVFERPAHFWLGLQQIYDESAARRKTQSASFADWAKLFPIKEMKELKFSLPEGLSDAEALLKFFGVANPTTWDSVWSSWTVAYRQTRVRQIRNEAVAAWVRETELSARELQVADYSDERLHAALSELRPLSRLGAERILEPIQKICAAAGVAVVLVPGLPGTGISGCARWLSSRRALVGLTLRYKTDDQLWFTLFHELAHILLHRNKRSFVIDNAANDLGDKIVDPEMEPVETEANTFARETLIPATQMSEFLHRKVFTNDSIHDFAERVQIGPGIVVGRLQHDGVILPHQGNRLKQKLDFGFTEEE
ncbi:MAG TPA: HigA family addiction module antitoxin [Chthoniobacterales bacterium]|jgi:addiction module HigA family antidote